MVAAGLTSEPPWLSENDESDSSEETPPVLAPEIWSSEQVPPRPPGPNALDGPNPLALITSPFINN